MKKWLKLKKTWLIFIVIVAIASWQWMKYKHMSATPEQEATVVEVVKVQQGEISLETQSVGSLVAAKNIQVTTEIAGQIDNILFQDGSFVKKGTPLIILDDAVSKAKYASAKANYDYSESNYQRMLVLSHKGAVAQQTMDQAKATLAEKKAAAEEARVLVEKASLVAPFDGVLGKAKVSPGEFVNVGQALVSLTDIDNLRVEFNVSEKYFADVKIGQQVTLKSSAYPSKAFYGKVAYIAPTINTEGRTISVYADVPNQDHMLTAGLFVNVTLLLGTKNNVLLIPASSLVATIDGQQVYKVVNNKAVAVNLTLGQRTENQVQVIEGLALGDVVVVAGQQKIKDGALVKFK